MSQSPNPSQWWALAPRRGDRHGTQRASWLRSWCSVAGGACCDDHAALAASLSSARSRISDVSCFVALRSVVCDSGRAAIHACRGDLLRGAEPLGQQLAAIPRSFLGCVSDQSRISCAKAPARAPLTLRLISFRGRSGKKFVGPFPARSEPRYTIWMAAAGDFSALTRTSRAWASSARLRAAPSETRTAWGWA